MIGVGQKSAIATNLERKTKYTFIMKIDNRKSKTVTKAFAKTLNTLPKYIIKSMTYDNRMEMANHQWLTDKTGIDIYFAHILPGNEEQTKIQMDLSDAFFLKELTSIQ